jgi:hypothetical protein
MLLLLFGTFLSDLGDGSFESIISLSKDTTQPRGILGTRRRSLVRPVKGPVGSLRGTEKVEVELKGFNDRALNRDLETLCVKVAQEQPRLPDGRRLLFRVQGAEILRLDAQEQAVA